jgi:phage shock protein E
MKRFIVSLGLALLVAALVGCSGSAAPAAEGAVVLPAANAPVIQPADYVTAYADSDHYLLDVRENSEVARGVIPGANHIPLGQLPSRVSELPTDKTVVVYCNTGSRSREAVRVLNGAGYTELLDLGGIQQWRRAGFDLVPLES